MVKFKGQTFYRLSQLIDALEHIYKAHVSGVEMVLKSFAEMLPPQIGKLDLRGAELPSEANEPLKNTFLQYRPHLEQAGLSMSLKSLDRLINTIGSGASLLSLADRAKDLQQRIEDELESTELWQIETEKRKFLNPNLFGDIIAKSFHAVADDLEEAGKCLAFGRATAAVFHLMRVMEVGLRVLGKSLNDLTLDPKRNPSWETILGRCDKEMQKPLKDRSPEWRVDEPFYSTATANLRAVKDAWRNTTLHVERRYTEEEAEEVFNATRAFMRHLAKNLSDTVAD